MLDQRRFDLQGENAERKKLLAVQIKTLAESPRATILGGLWADVRAMALIGLLSVFCWLAMQLLPLEHKKRLNVKIEAIDSSLDTIAKDLGRNLPSR